MSHETSAPLSEQSEFQFLDAEAQDVGLLGDLPPVARTGVQTADGSVSAIAWGDAAPTVVLLHGAGLNAHTWDGTVLALGTPAIALDLPGHGDSTWRDDADYRPRTIAPAVAEAAAAIVGGAGSDAGSGTDSGTDSGIVLVGQSLGGLTAAIVAAAHPELVRALVIVDVSPSLNASTGASQVREFLSGPSDFASREEIVDRAIAFGFGPSRADVERGVFLNSRITQDGRAAWKHHFANLGGIPEIEQSAFSGIWADLEAVRVPVTLVAGTHGVLDAAQLAEFQERLPDARIITIEAGHNIQEDAPVALAAAIRDIVDGVTD